MSEDQLLFVSSPVSPSAGGSLFGQPQQQAQQPQPAALLVARDGSRLQHSTRWDDISPQSQQELLRLEAAILASRESRGLLDGAPRLREAGPGQRKAVEQEAASLRMTMQSLAATLSADMESVQPLRESVLSLLRSAEETVAAYERAKLRRAVSAGQAPGPGVLERLAASGPPCVPSRALQQAVPRLELQAESCRRQVEEMERAVAQRAREGASALSAGGSVRDQLSALEEVLSASHSYLLHVAAKVAAAHDRVGDAKERHRARLAHFGALDDPFEAAAQRAAAAAAAARSAPVFAVAPAASQPAAAAPTPARAFCSTAPHRGWAEMKT